MMKALLILGLIMIIGCSTDERVESRQAPALPSKTTLPAPTLNDSENPIMITYTEHCGITAMRPVERHTVNAAVWADGRIVWRENDAMLQSRINVEKIDELLQRLHREGVFGDGKVDYGSFGPDSSFDVIRIKLPDRQLEMASWHEGFESNPKVVVIDGSVVALEGRKREDLLARQPPEYLRFRQIWSDIRSTIDSWIPTEGEPFTGTIPIDR